MSLPLKLNFSDYDNFLTDPNYTTSAEAQDYFRNMDMLVEALIDVGLWQPETNYPNGHVVFSPNMPNGTEAVCVATNGGKSSNTEPSWGEVGGASVSDGTCFWKLRWKHWSKSVEEIADLTTGATNRLPNKAYAVGNVVYTDSNLSVALKCTTAGTTSANELDISGASVGRSVTDGSVAWEVVPRFLPAETINELANELIEELFVGFIGTYAGNTPPNGWLACSGASLNPQTYTRLFGRIGTIYGGDGTTTFKLPNMNNGSFAEGNNTAGTVKSAGLPNITGGYSNHQLFAWAADFKSSGAISHTVKTHNYLDGTKSQPVVVSVSFDASRSNPIYGASTTVQPKSVTVKFCIKY